MIIDVHAHVFAFPRLHSRSRPELTFMSAAQQIRRMEEKGVDKAVILPLNGAEGPAERQSIGEVLHICEQYPDRFIPFCDIDPRRADLQTQDDFDDMLRQHQELGCKGLGELTVRLPFDDPRIMKLFAACEKVGFPVTFHTAPAEFVTYGLVDEAGMPRLEHALQRFPNLLFFGHSAAFWGEISGDLDPTQKNGYPKGPVAAGGALIRLMRTYPNLCGDLSAGSGFNALTRDPEFTWEFLHEFQDRLMLGLDHIHVQQDSHHIEWLTAARDQGRISAVVLDKIFWRNANRLIGLGLV